jgi:hypothetical protein
MTYTVARLNTIIDDLANVQYADQWYRMYPEFSRTIETRCQHIFEKAIMQLFEKPEWQWTLYEYRDNLKKGKKNLNQSAADLMNKAGEYITNHSERFIQLGMEKINTKVPQEVPVTTIDQVHNFVLMIQKKVNARLPSEDRNDFWVYKSIVATIFFHSQWQSIDDIVNESYYRFLYRFHKEFKYGVLVGTLLLRERFPELNKAS